MSDVEKLWESIRAKWPTPQPTWHELHPQRQLLVVQSLQMLIQAMELPNA